MTAPSRVLCLDDDPRMLNELERMLRTSYQVVTTTDPGDALGRLADAAADPFEVFIADMNMPTVGGITVLQRAYAVSPHTTRVLLADEINLNDTVAAINQGRVFELLLKPCPPVELHNTVAAATVQHRAATRTDPRQAQAALAGSVQALLATLAQAQPALVERAHRMRRIAAHVCATLQVPHAWQIELAAELTMVGAVTLPESTAEAVITGIPHNDAEGRVLADLFDRAAAVLIHVPGLAPVRTIIQHQLRTDRDPMWPLPADAPHGALVLQAVREYDALIHRGTPADLALATLTMRKTHRPELVAALAGYAGVALPNQAVREVTAEELAIGDELADDVHSALDLLLVSRGEIVTEQLLDRVRNFNDSTGLKGRILVTA
ncbi:response regulator receiver domain-containing protein [Krasilnikovia cinnamomea]|uniref:Response regulator receiver domain-containing protein n=1 Tax=Krasilnikovia cinnamomea TaxID=349313 RepID=A0A4Q7ZD65_9ACTN|nr:response regulator [Krasilnikovia cinnamomea]RZU48622.1 response regulator receiver domain-containing protein [Krasilnikovia cinnamomea]